MPFIYDVKVYHISFGDRVFMHRNGVIYQAEYRGLKVEDCMSNIYTKHIFWLGKKQGEVEINCYTNIYKSIEDATQEKNVIVANKIDMETFSNKYLRHLLWDGIQFTGWVWDGSKPKKYATRESLKTCVIRQGKVELIDYNGNVYDIDQFQRFYQTADECRRNHTPNISMLDDDDDKDLTNKRDEFYEYVKHHCPGFESKIDWEYFKNNCTMPENLAKQVRVWMG